MQVGLRGSAFRQMSARWYRVGPTTRVGLPHLPGRSPVERDEVPGRSRIRLPCAIGVATGLKIQYHSVSRNTHGGLFGLAV